MIATRKGREVQPPFLLLLWTIAERQGDKMKFVDLTGQRFGRLTVIERDCLKPKGGNAHWICQCDCGNYTVVASDALRCGGTTSCGCRLKEIQHFSSVTHGKTNTRLYRIWSHMKGRCYNPTDHKYPRYGGRGISICDEWKDDFQAFYDWAVANGYQEGLSIDRINNDGDYSPENCRWATEKQQSNNRNSSKLLTYCGETYTAAEWEEITGISACNIVQRINKYGWTVEDALTIPSGSFQNHKKKTKHKK